MYKIDLFQIFLNEFYWNMYCSAMNFISMGYFVLFLSNKCIAWSIYILSDFYMTFYDYFYCIIVYTQLFLNCFKMKNDIIFFKKSFYKCFSYHSFEFTKKAEHSYLYVEINFLLLLIILAISFLHYPFNYI